METSRYLDCLAQDYATLRSAAVSAGQEAPVPSCPGWTVVDLVSHAGGVYLYVATVMREGRLPDPWPPAEHAGMRPLALLDDGYRELTAEFAARPADDPAPTWYRPEQSVAFWVRRMAQETVVHRMDAQLAAGTPVVPAPDDLAADGVDEVLKRFLGYGSTEWPHWYGRVEDHLAAAADADTDTADTVIVTAGPTSWTVRPSPASVTVTDGRADGARAEITASPDATLAWLWGRAGDDAITVTGDREWAAYLRRLVAVTTG